MDSNPDSSSKYLQHHKAGIAQAATPAGSSDKPCHLSSSKLFKTCCWMPQ
jgi:hypothetical protein